MASFPYSKKHTKLPLNVNSNNYGTAGNKINSTCYMHLLKGNLVYMWYTT